MVRPRSSQPAPSSSNPASSERGLTSWGVPLLFVLLLALAI